MAKQRKGRTATEYVRRGPEREPYEYVIIVCEGKKTEPNYLNGLRVAYRLRPRFKRVAAARLDGGQERLWQAPLPEIAV